MLILGEDAQQFAWGDDRDPEAREGLRVASNEEVSSDLESAHSLHRVFEIGPAQGEGFQERLVVDGRSPYKVEETDKGAGRLLGAQVLCQEAIERCKGMRRYEALGIARFDERENGG